jgi:hypothetical protein
MNTRSNSVWILGAISARVVPVIPFMREVSQSESIYLKCRSTLTCYITVITSNIVENDRNLDRIERMGWNDESAEVTFRYLLECIEIVYFGVEVVEMEWDNVASSLDYINHSRVRQRQ